MGKQFDPASILSDDEKATEKITKAQSTARLAARS